MRNYPISTTAINHMISASSRMKKERERQKMIASSGGEKERPATYELDSLTWNEDSRIAQIKIIETKHYRTVERYVISDYKKYPILSDWKSKRKTITKSIKLSNFELENLQHNDDNLIRTFATEIVAKVGNPELYPSWFIKNVYKSEYEHTKEDIKRSIDNRKKLMQDYASSNSAQASKLKNECGEIEKNLEILNKHRVRYSKRCEKAEARQKSIVKSMITFFVYDFLRSPKYINNLRDKIEILNMKISSNNITLKEKQDKMVALSDGKKQKETELHKALDTLASTEKQAKEDYLKKSELVTTLNFAWTENKYFTPLTETMGYEYEEIMGCYIIRNTENGRCYVGQSKDIMRRLKQHFKGTEPTLPPILKDYCASKLEDKRNLFEIRILICDSKDELDHTEKHLIEKYEAQTKGYNSTKGNK